jgi:hypothetical protein
MYWAQAGNFRFFFFLFGRSSPSPFRLVLVMSVDTDPEARSVSLTNNETKKPLVRSSPGEHRMTHSARDLE